MDGRDANRQVKQFIVLIIICLVNIACVSFFPVPKSSNDTMLIIPLQQTIEPQGLRRPLGSIQSYVQETLA